MFDAAIVGAGPAGAWSAYSLARAGARVALIDGSHPREKPCGGGLSARALRLLAGRPGAAMPPGVEITAARFAANGAVADVPLGSADRQMPALAIVERRQFDGMLLQAARDAGAEVVPRRVRGLERLGGGWRIHTDGGPLEAAWLVGADGANSFVRRRVAHAFPRSQISVASGYFVHDRTDRFIDVEFTASPPGYLWSFPRPDHLAVGVCAQADAASSAQMLAASDRWIARHCPGASRTRYSWPIPSLTDAALAGERPAGAGWLLIGDAAGFVDPITREGIYFALRSGELAAASLQTADPETTYLQEIRGIQRELRKAARMKARFFLPRFTGLLVDGLHRSARIRHIMAGLVSGEHTYDGLRRRLLLTGEWRLALEYLQLARHDSRRDTDPTSTDVHLNA